VGCTVVIAFEGTGNARPVDGGGGTSDVTEVVGGGAMLRSAESLACRNTAEISPRNNAWFSTSLTDC
jgi:hypothetical protein